MVNTPREHGLHARLRRGLGGQAFSQAAAFGIQIGSVPLFLHFWGTALYGEWLVLAAFPAYLVISDLGFTTATSNEVTMRVSRGDQAGALVAFRTTWAFVSLLSVIVAAALVAGSFAVPLAEWFEFTRLTGFGASVVLALLLFQVLVNIQTGIAAAGLISAGQYGLHAFLTALTRLVAFAVVAVLLVLGKGPVAAALAMAAVECLGFAVVVGFASHHSKWMRYGLDGISRRMFRRLATPSIGFAGFILGNAISIQGPVIVIGAVVGPSAVAVFSTLRILARAVVMFANLVFANLRPEMAMAYGRDDIRLMRRISNRAIQFSVWLAGTAFVALLLVGPVVVDVWTVGRIEVTQPLFGLLLLAGMATLTWTGTATALYATNNNQVIALFYVVVASVGVLASIIAGFVVGTSGVAAMLALSELVVLVFVFVRTLNFLDQRAYLVLRQVIVPPIDTIRVLMKRPTDAV